MSHLTKVSFRAGYLTCLVNELVDEGVIFIFHCWRVISLGEVRVVQIPIKLTQVNFLVR